MQRVAPTYTRLLGLALAAGVAVTGMVLLTPGEAAASTLERSAVAAPPFLTPEEAKKAEATEEETAAPRQAPGAPEVGNLDSAELGLMQEYASSLDPTGLAGLISGLAPAAPTGGQAQENAGLGGLIG